MKVLHVTNAWPDEKNPIRGIFIKEQIDTIKEEGLPVDVHIISRSDNRGYIGSIKSIRSLSDNYDIIHAHHALSALTCILAGVPASRLVCSFLNERGKNILGIPTILSKMLESLVIHRSGVCIYKNNSFDKVRRKNDFLIGNAVDSERFYCDSRENACRKLGLDPALRYVLFVSANDLYRPAKRYDRFTEVIRILKIDTPNIEELTLVNEARDRVPIFFNASDLLLVCADHEGSPNVVKEALACGIPVVSTSVGDVVEQIRDIPDCEIVYPFDPALAAAAARRALASTTDRSYRRATYLANAMAKENVAQTIISAYRFLKPS